MKLFYVLFVCFCLVTPIATASNLLKFEDLDSDVQKTILSELNVEKVKPRIISNIGDYTGVRGSYVGMYRKHSDEYSFVLFLWTGTQGLVGATVSNVTKLPK